MEFTFEQLPQAVARLYNKLENIEKLLIANGSSLSPEIETLLTIQQAAELLSLAVPTIYSLVSKSEIPVSKQGKRLYFSKPELIAWIKSGRKKTHAEITAESHTYIGSKRR